MRRMYGKTPYLGSHLVGKPIQQQSKRLAQAIQVIDCDPGEKIECGLVRALESRMCQHSGRTLFHNPDRFLLAHLPALLPSFARGPVFNPSEIPPFSLFFVFFFLFRRCRRQSTRGEDTALGLYALKLGDTVHCLACCIQIVDRAANDGLDRYRYRPVRRTVLCMVMRFGGGGGGGDGGDGGGGRRR